MKKFIAVLLSVLSIAMCVSPVYAEELNEPEWFEMEEEEGIEFPEKNKEGLEPYSQYLINVETRITKVSSSKVALRADVYCASTVSKITTNFYLQKNYNGVWKNVSSGVASTTNSASMSKTMSVSGVTSGTYRAKTVTQIIDKYGYSETMTGYSGNMTM